MSDSPTAPREREMSALDRQVVEARKALEEWLYPRMGASEWESYNADVDALLTTHRRQVLEEVKDFIDKNAWTRQPLQQWLDTQLLRDTKENDQ